MLLGNLQSCVSFLAPLFLSLFDPASFSFGLFAPWHNEHKKVSSRCNCTSQGLHQWRTWGMLQGASFHSNVNLRSPSYKAATGLPAILSLRNTSDQLSSHQPKPVISDRRAALGRGTRPRTLTPWRSGASGPPSSGPGDARTDARCRSWVYMF